MSDTRSYNVGESDYSKHKIQPWDIWLEYNLNPWDADIVKRVLRNKQEPGKTPDESRILDYEKIKHVCDERIRQLKEKEGIDCAVAQARDEPKEWVCTHPGRRVLAQRWLAACTTWDAEKEYHVVEIPENLQEAWFVSLRDLGLEVLDKTNEGVYELGIEDRHVLLYFAENGTLRSAYLHAILSDIAEGEL